MNLRFWHKKLTDRHKQDTAGARLGISCQCGLLRLIPAAVVPGERVLLIPCPKCGRIFSGRYLGPDKGVLADHY